VSTAVTGLSNALSFSPLSVAQLTSITTGALQSYTGGSSAAVSGDSASISGPGKLLSEPQQLQQKDPTKFQEVVSQIATQLQSAAQQAGQGPQADFLSSLAQKLQNVASTGDLSQLQPPGPPPDLAQQAYASGAQGPSASQGLLALLEQSSGSSSSSTQQTSGASQSASQALLALLEQSSGGSCSTQRTSGSSNQTSSQTSSSQSGSSIDLQQLFTNILSEVTKALSS
jgi:hypothetical protein